ncbi:fimbrial-like adhesin protein [Escherichia coli]|uniref:Fimbrial-like adhesin protein n=1 Tax=Escherichia coli TaxID=562 RepID=A0A376RL44_ECOLX|nr:fimbrial-like adhesin protein [Escherichia coli]
MTAFITVVCATSSVMAADDNAITDGKVTFNGKVIAPACTLVAATKDSVVTLPMSAPPSCKLMEQSLALKLMYQLP